MLLCDPISVLILILVNLTSRVHLVIYRKLINYMFNLVFTQNILVLMKKLSNEQREIYLNVSCCFCKTFQLEIEKDFFLGAKK